MNRFLLRCLLVLPVMQWAAYAQTLTATPSPVSFTVVLSTSGNSWTPSTCTGKTCTQTVKTNLTIASATSSMANASAANWLSVSSPSGTSLQVTVDVTHLTYGFYTGRILITASGATNSPLAVPVVLAVYPQNGYSSTAGPWP